MLRAVTRPEGWSMDQSEREPHPDTQNEPVTPADGPRPRPSILAYPEVQAVLLQAATRDLGSGCLNGVYFAQRAREEIARGLRYRGRLSLLVIVPDPPDPPPDEADALLRRIAAVTRERLRASDLLGRLDDELVALLPGTGLAGATRLARRICATLPRSGGMPVPRRIGGSAVSIGVATWLDPAEMLATILERARAGLADARAAGGGRVGIG